jgi:hypothetical protein
MGRFPETSYSAKASSLPVTPGNTADDRPGLASTARDGSSAAVLELRRTRENELRPEMNENKTAARRQGSRSGPLDAPGARDYSETLFLPQTAFPMRAGLPQKEPEILARWEALDLYRGSGSRRAAGRSMCS